MTKKRMMMMTLTHFNIGVFILILLRATWWAGMATRFLVLDKLGEGGCGSVYKVEDIQNNNALHAMKVEFRNAQNGSVLKLEVQILQALVDKKHVAKLIYSGKKNNYSYMVMTLLGESLQSLIKKHAPSLNVSTQIRVGICLLFGIKQIHDVGYVHRDLKPANVALGHKGTEDERYFLVLDFGLARQFVVETEKGKLALRRPREKALFRGTARYCSLAMHERADQGRVDDLWAALYMLAEIRCKLPWTDTLDKDEIAELKRKTSDELLLGKSPVQLLEFAKYIRTLNFYDVPNYEKMYLIFEDVMKSADYKWTDPYHWEQQRHPKHKKMHGLGLDNLDLSKTRRRKKKNAEIAASTPKKKCGTASEEGNDKEKEKDVPLFTREDFVGNPLGF